MSVAFLPGVCQLLLGSLWWVELCPPKRHVHSEPGNGTLFGQGAFRDVSKLRIWRCHPPGFGVGPTLRDRCPYKRKWENGRRFEPQTLVGRRPCEHRGGGRDAATGQGSLEPPEAGRGKEGASPGASRESTALLTAWFQASALQSCEKIHFCCVKHPPPPFCVHLLPQPQEAHTCS